MKKQKIQKAIAEAKEFIQKAEELMGNQKIGVADYYYGSKLTGSLRRQSMELTRSLSELRKAD